MIPVRPTPSERKWAEMTGRMGAARWVYVHPDDIDQARDIAQRQAWWDTATVIGAAVLVLAVVTVALAVWP